MNLNRRLFLLSVALLFLEAIPPSRVLAQPFPISPLILIVNSTADEVDAAPGDGRCSTGSLILLRASCTLRAAIMEANAYPGPDTIIFAVDGTFALTITGADENNARSGDLDITDSLTIRGNGVQKTIIDGGGTTLNDRVFHIDPTGTGPTVSITFLTIQNGNAAPASEGGGVLNGICRATGVPNCDANARESRLMMDHVVIRSNSVSGIAFAGGGGLANNGYLHLTNSMIDGNSATVSGGLDNRLGATAELDQVVIISNTASLDTQGAPYGAGGGLMNAHTAKMTLTNSRLTNNHAPVGSGGGLVNFGALDLEKTEISSNESGFQGGGIFSGGSIDASNVTINQNTALRGGGGIYNGVNGSLILNKATINNNRAQLFIEGGGGIRNIGTMKLTNVTLSANTAADGQGGGIYNGNLNTSNLIATLTNVTVNGNQSQNGGGINNPGAAAAITLSNTIVANSLTGSNCTGQLTSNGHNLDSDNSCGFTSVGDIVNRNPHLYPLEDNGGPTQTQRLSAGFEVFFDPSGPFSLLWGVFVSAAVDAGDSASCPSTDQRGVIRPIGNGCDIGAYEFP